MSVTIGSVATFVVLFGVCSITVGRLLRTNGIVFLEQVFGSEGRVAEATNALLNIGYYLLCLSLLSLNSAAVADTATPETVIQSVSMRLGSSILVVAVIHFFNMLVFASILRRHMRDEAATALAGTSVR